MAAEYKFSLNLFTFPQRVQCSWSVSGAMPPNGTRSPSYPTVTDHMTDAADDYTSTQTFFCNILLYYHPFAAVSA